MRKELLDNIRNNVRYWAELPDMTAQERCDGVAFSILNIFDGTAMNLPAMNIALDPHEDDKAVNQNEGENWYEPGMVINDCMLHEMYYLESNAQDKPAGA